MVHSILSAPRLFRLKTANANMVVVANEKIISDKFHFKYAVSKYELNVYFYKREMIGDGRDDESVTHKHTHTPDDNDT